MSDVIAGLLILLGGFFAFVAALGLVRMPDVMIRMHASTKVGTLACGMIMAACALYFGTSEIIIRAVAIVLFLLLTAPIGAHMIVRSAISTGVPLWKNDGVDEDTLDPLKKDT
jgi:multicomponent Na+:H+ antiporter subunit G